MAPARTQDERITPPRPRARLLIRVLSYEDLLEAAPVVLRVDGQLPLTLGRADDGAPLALAGRALTVPDRWMSTGHATIEQRADGWLLVDHGSRNGTFVNGEKVREHELGDGDLLELGHTLFVYRVAEESAVDAIASAPALGPFRSVSPAVASLMRDVQRIAASTEPVLVLAETGAGKEVLARTLHALSGRPGALCTIDCGAVPEGLFEATFFGYRRGAFTGATDSLEGEIARADRGTLFLDEVANMSPTAQAKLLRVVEQGLVTPLGDSKQRKVDVRWVAATNKDLFGAGLGSFRDDLLQRLSGYVARLPPLRQRREDLGLLTAHLLGEAGVRKASITATAGRALFSGRFAGNVRELRRMLRSAALLAADAPIDVQHLPPTTTADTPDAPEPAESSRAAAPEAEEIEQALERTKGNVMRAAEALGILPRQLYRYIERMKLPLERFRAK